MRSAEPPGRNATMGGEGVLCAIQIAIVAGEFVAGQRLVEIDISEKFGASRATVRGLWWR